MSTPEVRLSPDGRDVAIRNLKAIANRPRCDWRASNGQWLTDAEVSEWTLLLPVSNEDGAP
jgi:hypothetical protein